MKQKIIILCYNYELSQFPTEPDLENRFFTYGFGGTFGKLFASHLDNYTFEVWRLDGNIKKKYYEKSVDNITYKIFKAFHIKKLGLFSWKFIKTLKNEVKLFKPILFIVHTHNFQTYQIAFFLKKAMIITTHHGDWSPYFVYKNTSGLRKIKALLGIAAEKLVMKNIDYFLLCDYKQVPYIKKPAPDAEWILFSSGLDVDKFKVINKSQAKEQLGLKDSAKYILYVGKLYKYKQVEELLNIWKDLKQKHPEIELLLVGNEPKGSWGEEYYDLAESYGANIIGRVLNNELYKYYCAADVYVLIALREDNFGGTGIAPLESLACNTPVVSNSMKNYLGNNAEEICEMPESLPEYQNAIFKVLYNHGEYKNMRESVEKYYSYNVTANRADEIFKKVLNKYKI
ncbi:MAG: glycosyltransferase family 4 protein [Ignavibacteria bacterium]|nr:glycosyltransferase family 4 protein [Ignavibacteria bacterium]